ncbi:class C sortase [Staphylococcus chromogenes]|nr:class C sortase [Staphylococcus chromogenes]
MALSVDKRPASYEELVKALDELYRKAKRKARIKLWISAVLALLGIAMMIYPVVATFQKNQALAEQINKYQNVIESLPPERNDAAMMLAWDYNRELSVHPIVQPPIGAESSDPDFSAYAKQLVDKPGDPMAQIAMPSVDINLPVFHGASSEVLKKGAGHLYGTSLPVGASEDGQTRTSAISAHTGMVNASMFDNLHKLKKGDSAFIRVRGRTLHYVMVDSKIVDPEDRDAVYTVEGKDLLQLITCTPYSVNTQRLVVTLERAPLPSPMPDLETAKNPYGPAGWQWWMTVTLVVALVFLLLFLFTWWSNRRYLRNLRERIAQRNWEATRDTPIGA